MDCLCQAAFKETLTTFIYNKKPDTKVTRRTKGNMCAGKMKRGWVTEGGSGWKSRAWFISDTHEFSLRFRSNLRKQNTHRL